jgi:hypothetical protein
MQVRAKARMSGCQLFGKKLTPAGCCCRRMALQIQAFCAVCVLVAAAPAAQPLAVALHPLHLHASTFSERKQRGLHADDPSCAGLLMRWALVDVQAAAALCAIPYRTLAMCQPDRQAGPALSLAGLQAS